MLIPSLVTNYIRNITSLSRRVNANSQLSMTIHSYDNKLIKKGEC